MSTRVRMNPTPKEFDRKLKVWADRNLDMTQPNKRVAIWLMRWVDKNFKREGALRYPGEGWEPFKLGGRRMKGGKIDTKAKLLQDTGRLKGSFSPFWGRKTAGVGSDLEYSERHEKGTATLSARSMLPVKKLVDGDVKRIYDAYFGRAVKRRVL